MPGPAEAPAHKLLPTGFLIDGRYRIVRPLGQGGMGTVYEAEHVKIEKRVAIKCLHAERASRESAVKRFHREALAATKIGHENIIDVVDLGVLDDGTAFMAMEYLEGCDFGALIAHEGPQPMGRVAHILTQVCEALGAAHAKGIVHRDLKPDNIFITERHKDSFFVKVFDFGISKFLGAEQLVSTKLTRTGMIIGTPWYMSPEQIDGGGDVDHRTDIYALGVILYYALTGRHPFEEDSFTKLVLAISTVEPPSARDLRPDTPEPIAQLCERMLSKDVEERPGGCQEIVDALAEYLDGDYGEMPELTSSESWGDMGASVTESGVVLMSGGGDVDAIALDETAQGEFGVAAGSESTGVASRSRNALPVLMLALVLAVGIGWWVLPDSGEENLSDREELAGEGAVPSTSLNPSSVESASAGSPQAVVPERAPIRLESDPTGATVWLGEEALGVTPLPVPRPTEAEGPSRFRLEMAGYQDATTLLGHEVESPHRVALILLAEERTFARPRSRASSQPVTARTPVRAEPESAPATQPSRSRPAPATRPAAPASMPGRFLDPWAGSM